VSRLPRLGVALTIVATMLAIIHHNTLVHPFTLADNRHYTFYVFRLLLRHPAIKYLAAPVYFLSAWATIAVLGGLPLGPGQPAGSVTTKKAVVDGESGNTASFVVVWLLTSALSLVTAPLVEPRYFILPWLMWRLYVPSDPRGSRESPKKSTSVSRVRVEQSWMARVQTILFAINQHRLWFETAWFLVVNWATGYIFLHWGYEWKQERGVVQRFMW